MATDYEKKMTRLTDTYLKCEDKNLNACFYPQKQRQGFFDNLINAFTNATQTNNPACERLFQCEQAYIKGAVRETLKVQGVKQRTIFRKVK